MTESLRGAQYDAAFLLTAAAWPAICTFVVLLCCSAQASWPPEKRQRYLKKQQLLRQGISRMLDIPNKRVDLGPESRGQIERDGIVIEKWIFTSEPGSRWSIHTQEPALALEAMIGSRLRGQALHAVCHRAAGSTHTLRYDIE